MSAPQTFKVPDELAGIRLDRVIATLTDSSSRSQVKEAIVTGNVTVEGTTITNPRFVVTIGEEIIATIKPRVNLQETTPVNINLDIHAKDEEYLIINKPAGMVMHPARSHYDDTLANAIAAYCTKAANLPRAGVVHRLDKDTSGLVVIARSEKTRLYLIEQFKERKINRNYLAIVHGKPPATGLIERDIARDKVNRLKMSVVAEGKTALTRYTLISSSKVYSLIKCKLESGRTHQIRVHLEHLGYPIAGDTQYKNHAKAEGNKFPRQMLHAKTIGFTHPVTNEYTEYENDPPADFLTALNDVGLKLN